MSRAKRNVLANRSANVVVMRGGLSIEIENVPAIDAALVADCVLRAFRQLIAAGHEELVMEGPSHHSDPIIAPPESEEEEDGAIVPVPSSKSRRVGFR